MPQPPLLPANEKGPNSTGAAVPNAAVFGSNDEIGKLLGDLTSGPFRLLEWKPGKLARFEANNDFSGGRAFVDAVEIELSRTPKDRLVDVELGKTDIAQLTSEDARRATQSGVRISTSQLNELVAVAFISGRSLSEDIKVRHALAQVIDRPSIADFILQKEGQAAGGLLPQWSSGTAFLFSSSADPSAAQEQWSQIRGSPRISVGYDAGDALEQVIAERIVVNAHEAGIPVVGLPVSPASAASMKVDARLLRLRMEASDPRAALAGFLATLDSVAGIKANLPSSSASPEAIYECEREIVSSYRVIPLVWLPQVYGLSSRVRNWKPPEPGGSWPLADVWLDEAPDAPGPK